MSNDPHAYSSDLFDIVSAQIIFGSNDQLPLMEVLAESGDGIISKIDEVVRREVKFEAEMVMKQRAMAILEVGCNY